MVARELEFYAINRKSNSLKKDSHLNFDTEYQSREYRILLIVRVMF